MKLQTILCGMALTATAAFAQTAPNYTVRLNLTEDEDGLTAYITDFDSGEKVDSTVVADGVALFNGTVGKPIFARLILDGNRAGMFILEPGEITVGGERRIGTGTATNEAFNTLLQNQNELVQRFNKLTPADTTEAKAIRDQYNALSTKALAENAQNPLGYYLFVQEAYNWDLPEFNAKLKEYPQFADSRRLQTLKQGLLNKEETSVGHKFKDFENTYDGKTQRLSDYVGRGRYTLVDFWASWCGPCRREIPVIKKLYESYKDKDLNVVGVAVWDEPAATIKAIDELGITWPCIIDAQKIPTDIYGISGIPCIILIDPDGIIVSRDKQGDQLVADVNNCIAQYREKQKEAKENADITKAASAN